MTNLFVQGITAAGADYGENVQQESKGERSFYPLNFSGLNLPLSSFMEIVILKFLDVGK